MRVVSMLCYNSTNDFWNCYKDYTLEAIGL